MEEAGRTTVPSKPSRNLKAVLCVPLRVKRGGSEIESSAKFTLSPLPALALLRYLSKMSRGGHPFRGDTYSFTGFLR